MGEKRTYWLDLFTYSTWRQFMDAGHAVTGFRETRWRLVKQIKPGDYLLCYLTGVSRWIGLLEATSEGYLDETPVWSEAVFPARVQVRLLVELARMPPVLRSKAGVVTVPENEPEDETTREDTLAAGHGAPKEATEHTEFQ